jgi:hypothetical protein
MKDPFRLARATFPEPGGANDSDELEPDLGS